MRIIFCYILKIFLYPIFIFTLLMPQKVDSLPTVWKTRVRFLGREDPLKKEMATHSSILEDPLEKEMATHSSILAWRIPWTEEPGRLQSMRLQRVGHD